MSTVPILDLGPRLIARRQSACEHNSTAVDMTAAVLECVDCGAPLDPWWHLRRLATQSEWYDRQVANYEAALTQRQADFEKWRTQANERIALLEAQISALYETKSRLANEVVGGVRVGAVRRRKQLPGGGQ